MKFGAETWCKLAKRIPEPGARLPWGIVLRIRPNNFERKGQGQRSAFVCVRARAPALRSLCKDKLGGYFAGRGGLSLQPVRAPTTLVCVAMSNRTEIVLAVDGGATRTRAWIARLDGTVLGRGGSTGSNVYELGVDVARRVIAEAALAAWHEAGLPGEKPCAFHSVFAGVAGAGAVEDQRALAAALAAEFGVTPQSCCVDHDLRIALAGALAGDPGAVILAGTGSAAYGRDRAGRTAKAGGWGPVLDDGGSGHWLGVQAMRTVIRVADGRAAPTPLADAVLARLGVADPREMLNRLQPTHAAHLHRAAIAALAPLVIVAAEAGEIAAQDILDRGAGELADKAAAVLGRLGAGAPALPRLAGAGGLLENHAIYFARVGAAVSRRLPGVRLESPQLSPVAGALLLALEMAGVAHTAEVLQRLGRETAASPA